jgi:hypothetical protein
VITCILSGGGDPLGRRVAAQLAADESIDRIVVLDDGELVSVDLKERLEGASLLVHLAGGIDETRAVLEAAGAAGVRHAVVLSSATVYGAWHGNPVPLTEEATLRPNPELEFAVRAAERERLAAEWRADHPGTTVALLRPAVPVAEDATGWLADGLRAAALVRSSKDDDPPAQYVHLDDLASAVALATTSELDGAYNVAPDGWITGEQLRALAGGPRVRLPERVARLAARWRAQLAPASARPGLLPYTQHPWVVANDRLRAKGWVPEWSSEEAYVAGHPAAPWAAISPQRRQELALGALAVALVGSLVGAVALIRRHRRRAR